MWYFEDFFVLNLIGTFILLCKLYKTAKNDVKVAKNAFWPFFGPPSPKRGAEGVKSKYAVLSLNSSLFRYGVSIFYEKYFCSILGNFCGFTSRIFRHFRLLNILTTWITKFSFETNSNRFLV